MEETKTNIIIKNECRICCSPIPEGYRYCRVCKRELEQEESENENNYEDEYEEDEE